MTIIDKPFSITDLNAMSQNYFGDMVKGVVDIKKNIIAVDAELHSDLESLLLSCGSEQENLWGINLYPEFEGDGFIEFDSLINIRPRMNNRSRGVEDVKIQEQIKNIVNTLIVK